MVIADDPRRNNAPMCTRRVLVRTLISISLVLSLLVAAAWVRSYFVGDWVQRAAGEVEAPPAKAPTPSDPFAAEWRYHHRTMTVRHDSGMLYLVRAVYTSYRGTHEELKTWENERGWKYQAFDAGMQTIHRPAHFGTIVDWSALGMGIEPFSKQGEDGHAVVVPYAFVLALVGWPAAWWGLHVWRIARRRRAGLCLKCGYNLRGARGVCPECGTAAA